MPCSTTTAIPLPPPVTTLCIHTDDQVLIVAHTCTGDEDELPECADPPICHSADQVLGCALGQVPAETHSSKGEEEGAPAAEAHGCSGAYGQDTWLMGGLHNKHIASWACAARITALGILVLIGLSASGSGSGCEGHLMKSRHMLRVRI